MSFYLSFVKSIRNRKVDNIFYFEDSNLFLLSGGEKIKLTSTTKETLVESILNYIKIMNTEGSEILLPSLEEHLFYDALKRISNYLDENDDSIGLLIKDSSYIHEHKDLLDEFGVTYRLPKIEIIECVRSCRPVSKPKERTPRFSMVMMPSSAEEPSEMRREAKTSGLILDESFNKKFIKFLNESGKTNVEVYQQGGVSRQVFSKTLSDKSFIPKKNTIICLIIGMELNYKDAITLLTCAGYALSPSIVFDVVVAKYLKQGIYDLDKINDELYERNCPLLGYKKLDQ